MDASEYKETTMGRIMTRMFWTMILSASLLTSFMMAQPVSISKWTKTLLH
jgi:hypothetical protein